jgi:hypothetical protein
VSLAPLVTARNIGERSMRSGILALLAAALSGCGADTGSQRFAFEARAGGAETATGAPLQFTNQAGWAITLTRADVTLGPLYLNVQPPLRMGSLGSASPLGKASPHEAAPSHEAAPRRGWLDWLVPPAFAQAAHLDEGRVVGEVLGQVTFSALSAELVPFPMLGALAQEEVRTAEVWYYPTPSVSAEANAIDTVALDVAGEASRDGLTYAFAGRLLLNDEWLAEQAAGTRGSASLVDIRQVRGIAAGFFPEQGGHLELRLDVMRLFRGANFASLEDNPPDPSGVRTLVQAPAARDQVMSNLYQGLREANGTYAVSWVLP